MAEHGARRQGDPKPLIGRTLQRPVLSPDGNFIAAITPSLEIHIISLAQACPGSRVTKRIILPKTARNFLSQCHILRWSPETMLPSHFDDNATNTTSEVAFGMTWLVLSDGDRVIAVSTELSHGGMVERGGTNVEDEASNVLADFEFGKQYGLITSIDFVFSHRHVLILFELCTHASIISLTKFQRDDVLLPKFPDARSFAQSPQNRHFALLTRSNGQDQISVFSPSDDASDRALTFNSNTLDAQGIQWCPDGDPMLAVWDSASYGSKILFFTALGHHLRHLDITGPDLNQDLGFSHSDDLSVLRFEWLCRGSKTLVTVAGPKHARVFEQPGKATVPMLLASYDYPDPIETSDYPIWQESSMAERKFSRLDTALEATPHDDVSVVEKLALNADCSLIATKDSSRPRRLWIWPISSQIPLTVLNFREHVKQILWHPSLPDVMLILTSQKEPTVYIWHNQGIAPAIAIIPLSATYRGTGRFMGSWLPNETSGRHLFMMSSPDAFDIGSLEGRSDGVFFESVLQKDFLFDEPSNLDTNSDLTPTRSDRKVTINAPWSLSTDKDDPIHSCAKGMEW